MLILGAELVLIFVMALCASPMARSAL